MSPSLLVALVATVFIVGAVAQTVPFEGNICGFQRGAAGNPWFGGGSGWTVVFHASIQYTWGSASANRRAPAGYGTFWQATGVINGTYRQFSSYNTQGTSSQAIVDGIISGFAPIGTDYASNAIYNSSVAYYPIDGNGLTLNFANGVEFPGQNPFYTVSQQNVWYTGGALRVANTGIINETLALFISDLPGADLVGLPGTKGNFSTSLPITSVDQCVTAFSAVGLTVAPAIPPETQEPTNSLHTLYYSISDHVSYQVNVSLQVKLTTASFLSDSFGVSRSTFTVLGGTRSYGWGTPANGYNTTVVSTISASACAPAQFLYTSSNQYPFIDATGVTFQISPAAPLDGQEPGSGVNTFATWTAYAYYSTGLIEENNVETTAYPTAPQTVTFV